MSLRIPLTNDQTLQVEFHEIERRLRKLEKGFGKEGETTILKIGGNAGGTSSPQVDLTDIYDRLSALEELVAELGTGTVAEFNAVGDSARAGTVPTPGVNVPPTGVGEHVLKEDKTWGFPVRGLIGAATSGQQTDLAVDVLDIQAGLHTQGISASDIECFNLHTHADIEYGHTFWEDLRFPATGFNPAGSTAPPAILTTNGLLSFSGTADNIIGGVAQLPHGWKEGTAISPHIHLVFPTANPGTNTRWKLEYNVGNISGDFTTDSVTYTALTVITVPNANNIARHILAEFADIPMTGMLVSSCVLWRLTRLAASDGADDDTNACTLLEIDFHYEADSPGSSSEFTK